MDPNKKLPRPDKIDLGINRLPGKVIKEGKNEPPVSKRPRPPPPPPKSGGKPGPV